MLSLLHIENIAVIESQEIAFAPGFNALSGETGAGKSMVVGSLGALLGERMTKDRIRTGASSAIIQGVFQNIPQDAARWIEEQGFLLEDDELILSRTLAADGKSTCRINGKLSPLASLRELAPMLLGIHGQQDNAGLLRTERHLSLLDTFAGIDDRDGVPTAFFAYRDAVRALRKLEGDLVTREQRLETLSGWMANFDALAPKPNEEALLSARRDELRNAEKIVAALKTAYTALYGTDNVTGACDLAEQASGALHAVLPKRAAAVADVCDRLRGEAEELRALWHGMENAEEELSATENRLLDIKSLCRKHNLALDALIAARVDWETEAETLQNQEQSLAELRQVCTKTKQALTVAGECRRQKRLEAARRLEAAMERELADLEMPKATFFVSLDPAKPSVTGLDAAAFFFSANPGEPPKPLQKVASGGELARLMLAVKHILGLGDSVETLVFDEIDTGVSGRAAQKVAKKLQEVAGECQVICVSHLPQIAAMAETHFRIHKSIEGERTVTTVDRLSPDERVEEIARLLAGESITEKTRENARELLS